MPVLEGLAGAPVSIDTSKAEVARRALALGAELVNDVTALRGDAELAGVVAEAGAYVCLMHMRGEPRTMQADPVYDDVVSDVKAFLEERLAFAVAAGIREELVCLDPGIGFGKTVEHNFELVRRSTSWSRSAGRSSSASRARARSAGILGDPGGDDRHARGVGRRGRGGLRPRRDDPPRARRARARRGAARRRGRGRMKIELRGLELFGHHGVTEEERDRGQLFVYDVELEVGERGANDRIEDAVDYREVAATVRRVADAALRAARGALRRDRRCALRAVRAGAREVRVRKPEVRPAGIDLDSRPSPPSGRDASRTSGSARTSATASTRSGTRRS